MAFWQPRKPDILRLSGTDLSHEIIGRVLRTSNQDKKFHWYVYERGAIIAQQGEENSVELCQAAIEQREKLYKGYHKTEIEVCYHEAGHVVSAHLARVINIRSTVKADHRNPQLDVEISDSLCRYGKQV